MAGKAQHITLFSLLAQASGLSLEQAANLLGATRSAVASWSNGRRTAPDYALRVLCTLAAKIDGEAALQVEKQMLRVTRSKGTEAPLEVSVAPNDVAAIEAGFPNAGAQAAYVRLLVARLMDRGIAVKLVQWANTVSDRAEPRTKKKR